MAFVCVKDGDPICDYLDPEAADRFIQITHQSYYDRFAAHFGTTIETSFFDEPTLYRAKGRTWTDQFNEKFQARYGFDPRPYYPALWEDIGPETQSARKLSLRLSERIVCERLYQTHPGLVLRGMGSRPPATRIRKEVVNPVSVSGDLMKCFQHLEIPGIDKIGGDRPAERFYKIVSSAAYNWDRSLVMSETYGAMGDLSLGRYVHRGDGAVHEGDQPAHSARGVVRRRSCHFQARVVVASAALCRGVAGVQYLSFALEPTCSRTRLLM